MMASEILKDELLHPRGPRAMAERLTVEIAQLEQDLSAAKTPTAVKRLRKTLKLHRNLLRWCKTRTGY